MSQLKINKTLKTPAIHFDSQTGHFEITGKSVPENAFEFYKPAIDWIDAYSHRPVKKTTLKIFLEYFNSGSSRSIFEILKRLESVQSADRQVVVNWYYELDDEDTRDVIESFQEIISVPVNVYNIIQ